METNTTFEAGALTGRQQAFAMIATKCSYAQAVCLKEIHDTRAYEQAGLTWEQFCIQQAGISRGTAETIIRRLDEFGEAYFRLAAIVRISPDTFRRIADRLTAETIQLNGEEIPLTSDNACKIRAGIRKLQDEVRRLNNHYRAPTRVTEYGIRLDDMIEAVSARARLGRALPKDELSHLCSLADHAVRKWTEIAEMLASPAAEALR
jgi:hypothetical protein